DRPVPEGSRFQRPRSPSTGTQSRTRDRNGGGDQSASRDDRPARDNVRVNTRSDGGGGRRFGGGEKRGPQLVDAAEAQRLKKLRYQPRPPSESSGQRDWPDRRAESSRFSNSAPQRTGRDDRGEVGQARPPRSRVPFRKPSAPAEIAFAPRPTEPVRIAKAMARAGLCSRREAERWIEDGRVSINGRVLNSPAMDVGPRDVVKVDGQPLPLAEAARLWRYHKPKGLVTTHYDPEGRPTVFDSLPPDLPRVVSIGRLDYNSEGLLLLTNDGELARHLELPSTGWLRRYRVRAYGRLTQDDLDPLKDGITVEGITYGPIEATLDSVQSGNMWLTMGLREGKNREVRKILGSLGLEVNRLIRISFGPFQLLDLEPGAAETVRRRVLADQLGPDLAAQFGLLSATDDDATAAGGPVRKAFRVRREPDGARRREKNASPQRDAVTAGRPDNRSDDRPARSASGVRENAPTGPGRYIRDKPGDGRKPFRKPGRDRE
ncbi:MAG: pseudouridine synthase, partial [Hyphomicrobium aestuarii]|nr:pseudouridine synthase [Hyphomicrobium aestuarii]